MIVALIPARGGSRRLPGKNIREFAGRPLLCYSIEAAGRVPRVDRCVVSTEDEEIARVARECGAEVLMRPPELATDTAPTVGVAGHFLGSLAGEGVHPEALVTLQPNCPLRPPGLIERAIQLFLDNDVDSVVSVSEDRRKCGAIKDGLFSPEYLPGTRWQDMEPRYFENGLVYVSDPRVVLEAGSLFGERVLPLVVDPFYAMGDIDTELDLEIAEFLFTRYPERFNSNDEESWKEETP